MVSGNFFHRTWKNARDGVGGFNCRFGTYTNPEDQNESFDDRLMYWVKPGCDSKWLEVETADDSPRDIAQERLCSFLSSGETFVDPETIARLEIVAKSKKPISKEYMDRNLLIWHQPERGGIYLIGCDVSRGDAKDFSAFHVLRIDCSQILQVAEYKGKIKPNILGDLLVSVSKTYNNAIIAPENNSGWSGPTILAIQQANHPFLYYTRRKKQKIKNDQYRSVDPYYAEISNDYLPGYAVTSANRLPMLAKMEQYIRMQHIIINSERLVDELKTFIVSDGGRPEARRGDSDDLVLALAGAIWVREESFMHIIRNTQSIEEVGMPFYVVTKTTDDIKEFHNNKNQGIISHDYITNKIKLGNGEEIDLNSLIGKG